MSDLISSDSTNTYDTLFTDTTLIINASKCIFCDKILGYQGKFSSNAKYHSSCLEERRCFYCGTNGLNFLCQELQCQNVFHLFCHQRYSKKLNSEELKCPAHNMVKKDKRDGKEGLKEKSGNFSETFRKIANEIQGDEDKLEDYKEQRGDIKASNGSHGQIFWALINSQYFTHQRLYQFPILYSKSLDISKRKHEKSWVSSTVKALSKDYKNFKTNNSKLFKEYFPGKLALKTEKYKYTEKELLTSECRSVKLKKCSKDFIQFMENNLKPEQPDEGDDICDICLECDYEDDDLILKCKICFIKVHMQCYGITSDDKEWTCKKCKNESLANNNISLYCGLCPIKGGVLKRTVTHYSQNFSYLDHLNLNKDDLIWVHVFCATHIDNNCIKNKIEMDNIDLGAVDKKRFLEKCNLCGTNKGGCIKCLSSKCRTFFHPMCIRSQFLYTRNHSGFDPVGPYCDQHRTSRLRKSIELKESQLYSDFCTFIKIYEKIDKVCVKRAADSDFSYDEKFQVFELVDKFLSKTKSKFEVVFKCNRNDKSLRGVIEGSIEASTFIEPDQMVDEEFHTLRHEPFEVKDYYAKNVFEIMKQEVKILKLPLIAYSHNEEQTIN